jgi:hypothetical protein
MTKLNEKAFVAHPGKIVPWNANFGQIFRPNLTSLPRQSDRALPERRFRATRQPHSLSTVSIPLPYPRGRLWRSLEGNRQHIVRIFIRPGEPNKNKDIAYPTNFRFGRRCNFPCNFCIAGDVA